MGREVVVDESVEFERWLGVDDFEDEDEPIEIFWRGGAVSWTGVWGGELMRTGCLFGIIHHNND